MARAAAGSVAVDCGNLATEISTPKHLLLKDLHFGGGFCNARGIEQSSAFDEVIGPTVQLTEP